MTEQPNTPLYGRGGELRAAAKALLDACYLADVHEELPDHVDGSLLDALSAALSHPCREVTEEEIARIVAGQPYYEGGQFRLQEYPPNPWDYDKARAILAALSSPLGDLERHLAKDALPRGETLPDTPSEPSADKALIYRGYEIRHDPITCAPLPELAWAFVHKDYDGGYYDAEGSVCEGDPRHGRAASSEAGKSEIDALEDDT